MRLCQLAGRIAGGEAFIAFPSQLQPFLPLDILLLGGGPAVLIDDFIPRGPRQERDQVLLVVQVDGTGADPVEEAPPHALEEVERIEPRPQQPGQLGRTTRRTLDS